MTTVVDPLLGEFPGFIYLFIFCSIHCRVSYESEHRNTQQGEQETREVREGREKTVEQRHEEICGRKRDGAGYTG